MRWPEPPPRDPYTDDGSFGWGCLIACTMVALAGALVALVVVVVT